MAKKNTDTVKAMLTPGEFVIKKKSAKKIGYGKLNQINKTGKVNTKKEAKMPQGIGTYGSKVGRPTKKAKAYKKGGKAKKLQYGGVVRPPASGPKSSKVELQRGFRGINPIPPRTSQRPVLTGVGRAGRMREMSDGGKVTSKKSSSGYAIHGESDKYKVGE